MRSSIFCLLFSLVSCVGTQPVDAVDATPSLAGRFRTHDAHPVEVAALVVDLDSGETLLSREAQRLLRPASTMKVLTTAAACRRDPDRDIVTSLSVDAVPVGAVTLHGACDPFLSTEDLRELVRSLKQQGLERVRGGEVRVADPLAGGRRFGQGWMWDDEPAAFMPALCGVPVDSGCVTVEVQGTSTGLEASLSPTAGTLELRVSPGAGRLAITRGRYSMRDVVTVSGRLDAGRSTSRSITVPDPARYTAWVLASILADEGLLEGDAAIRITGPASDSGAARVELRRSMAEIIERTNKPSDNLGAELVLRLLPSLEQDAVRPGTRAEENGIAALRDDVARLGLEPNGYRLSDGSGVSHYTLVSAELLVRTLIDMDRIGGRSFEVFERSLPVAGRDGTLAGRMRGSAAEERVHAKTGTLSGVSNLAGYVTTKSGRRLAFALLMQNFVGSARPWRTLQDQFCAELAEL